MSGEIVRLSTDAAYEQIGQDRSGVAEITDRQLAEADREVLAKFERTLTELARRLNLHVKVSRDLMRAVTVIRWEPAYAHEDIGVWMEVR